MKAKRETKREVRVRRFVCQVQRKRGARARNGIATFVLCVPLSNIWTLIVSILTRAISVVSS
jgi:hypothetical protein